MTENKLAIFHEAVQSILNLKTFKEHPNIRRLSNLLPIAKTN